VDTAKTCLSVSHWIDLQLRTRRSIRHALVDTTAEIKTRLALDFNAVTQQWSPWKHSWSTVQKQLNLIENLYSSSSERKILAPKRASALQVAQAMSSQEKEMLNLKSLCMEFSKLPIPTLATELEQQEATTMKQALSTLETIYTQFRKDKALRMDQNPDVYHNELKWHALQRKQVKAAWECCRDKLNEEETGRFKAFSKTAGVYFSAAVDLAKRVTKAEDGIRNMEEIIRAFGKSLEKLPKNIQPTGERILQHDPTSSDISVSTIHASGSMASTTGSVHPLEVSNAYLSIVKGYQDLRNVAQENRQVVDRYPASGMQ